VEGETTLKETEKESTDHKKKKKNKKSASTGQQQHGTEALWTGRCEIRQMSFFGAEEGWGGEKKTVGVGDVPFRFLFLSRQKEWRFRRQSKAKKKGQKRSRLLCQNVSD
jgi:hypothetical protein